MPDINTDALIEQIHDTCGDMTHTQEESAEAYEEIAEVCAVSARAIREEMDAG